MISWFKKKTKPFSSAEALKKSEAAKLLKEANELKAYKQSLFEQIESRCKFGYTDLYCGGNDTFNKHEVELTKMFKDYGYKVDKKEDAFSFTGSITYSMFPGLIPSPTPTPTKKTYSYTISWGDKETIFNNEMKEIISEANSEEED